jgi:hypothetical protein
VDFTMSSLPDALAQGKWAGVTPDQPCAICGRPDWCSRTADGRLAVCRRSPHSATHGAGDRRVDRSGGDYWLYRLGPALPPPGPPPSFTLADGKGERADADVLHQVYTAFLEALALTYEHRVALRGRGLSDAAIDLLGYRSLGRSRAAAVRKLIEGGLEQHLPRVPGFFVRETEAPAKYWTAAGPGGMLVPVRDANGRTIALMVRRDDGAAAGVAPHGKYTYLSARKRGGPGPGSPVHIPLHPGLNTTLVRVTEGALKADLATTLSGVLTAGLPGVGTWRRAAPVLAQLGARVARLAFDADASVNRAVARALANLAEDLRAKSFTVEVERWGLADGKGIDDLLAAGKKPEVLTGDAAFAAVSTVLAAAAKAGGGPEVGPSGDGPLEEVDDPHRLAALFKARRLKDL